MTLNYPNAEIFIAGDLNARTKDFYDYIPDDPPCGMGIIIHPLLDSVRWCKPIKHRHAPTHIHTEDSPALFDG